MALNEQIDNNIWVSIDGELKQLRPLVAQLEERVQELETDLKEACQEIEMWASQKAPGDE